MRVSHSYDAAGREIALRNVSGAGVGLAIYTALYDAAGSRLNNIELDGTRVTWTYDASYQLINEQRSGVSEYALTYPYDDAIKLRWGYPLIPGANDRDLSSGTDPRESAKCRDKWSFRC